MKRFFLISGIIFTLAGCSKINEIQYQSYAVGLGIDYVDHEYRVYVQFLDFSNVAKTEQGKSDQPATVWMASGTGKSLEEALNKIYQGIQLPVNFDQLTIFLFGKSLLEHKLEKTLQALDTNFDIRSTGWVYGTEEKLADIFTTKVPFNYAFSSSRINHPDYMQQQQSTIPAITLQELIYQCNERTKTILLPNISIQENIMKKDTKKVPVTTFNGAFIIKDKKLKDLLTINDLKGYITVNNKAVRSLFNVKENKEDNEDSIVIELLKPKLKRRIIKSQNDIKFGLDIKLSGVIRDAGQVIASPKIKKEIEEKIKSEVYESYNKSQEIGGDIYQLEDYLYRFMHNDWKKLHDKNKFPTLKKEDIHVRVEPLHSITKFNSGVSPLLR
ncbi:Ger(x)C family spore germination protein [Priestia abyssalis]|uniref:Ger(x)C family spore germination protein n=1 Tax=Priestia abyssalis TaxID=1221450 RepID=UPI00099535B3|nr:Ger(x)C family spore germination protein [Priestia abyssalis]